MTSTILENSLSGSVMKSSSRNASVAASEIKLSFLNKFRKRQKSRASYASEKIRVAFGESLEFKKIQLHIGT